MRSLLCVRPGNPWPPACPSGTTDWLEAKARGPVLDMDAKLDILLQAHYAVHGSKEERIMEDREAGARRPRTSTMYMNREKTHEGSDEVPSQKEGEVETIIFSYDL